MFSFFTRSKKQRTVARPLRRPSHRPVLELLEERCLLSSGALDPTFGSGGTVTTALNKNDDCAHGLLLQSNGDLIAYGTADTKIDTSDSMYPGGFGLARYTPSGNLDSSFGSGGIVTTFSIGSTSITFPDDNTAYPAGVTQAALQGDGKIVAVGGGSFVVRYNSNGSIDTTFRNQGLVVVPSGFAVDSVLILPSNGDMVLGGYDNNGTFALLCYTPTGILDSTFGNGGEVLTSIAGVSLSRGYQALALENGDIVAGGDGGVLARYTLSGSLDTTFGSGGIVTGPDFQDGIRSLLVQPNGQIVAVGTAVMQFGNATGAAWSLARFNTNGSLDSTFGSGGIVTTSISNGYDHVAGAALESNGQIVVVGWTLPKYPEFAVGVYNANGSLDTSFGSGGFVYQSTNGIGDHGGGVVLQPDGKIVTAWSFWADQPKPHPAQYIFKLARYEPSAAQIGSFTASPNPVMAGSSVTLSASNLTLADPNSTITQVTFYYFDANGDKVVLGTGTSDGSGDWILTSQVNLASGKYTLYAQAQDSDGILGDPDALTLTVQ